MKVELITKTAGVGKYEGRSIDEIVVGQARVSTTKENNELFDTDTGLLKYCTTEQHWSIFDNCSLGFEIETSRAIGRQFIRHYSMAFQEFSQRYSDVTSFQDVELRRKGITNRQGSSNYILGNINLKDIKCNDSITEDEKVFLMNLSYLLERIEYSYQQGLKLGIANESIRFFLPETTSTKLNMTGNLRSWITFLNVRLDHHTQKEARLIAEQIKNIFIQECPIISKAFFNFETDHPSIKVLERLVLEKFGVYGAVISKLLNK